MSTAFYASNASSLVHISPPDMPQLAIAILFQVHQCSARHDSSIECINIAQLSALHQLAYEPHARLTSQWCGVTMREHTARLHMNTIFSCVGATGKSAPTHTIIGMRGTTGLMLIADRFCTASRTNASCSLQRQILIYQLHRAAHQLQKGSCGQQISQLLKSPLAVLLLLLCTDVAVSPLMLYRHGTMAPAAEAH